jgi:hypothetical protein
VYFVPKKSQFWTLKDSFVETTARMRLRCGGIAWFGDAEKVRKLQGTGVDVLRCRRRSA